MQSSCTFTDSTPSWEDYFELSSGGLGEQYEYKDTSVIELPDDLPQPPSDYPVSFSECYYLVNIDALAKWDTSKMTSTAGMFNHCHSLEDISPLRSWTLSNVTNMSYMFNCCYALRDVSAITLWNVSKVTKMRFIFNGCHALPDFARLDVYDQQTFDYFVEQYLIPQAVEWYLAYNTDDEIIEIEEEEEIKEEWDEETMGPYPFPDAYSELTRTIDQPTDQPNDILNDYSDNDDLTMTLTPAMMRKHLISSSEEDEPY